MGAGGYPGGMASTSPAGNMASTLPTSPVRPSRPGRPVIALVLSDLQGPGEGIMQVPRSLIWSGGKNCGRIDLGNRHAVAVAYESFLDAARNPADLAAYLNARLLVTAWPNIGMAPARRRAW